MADVPSHSSSVFHNPFAAQWKPSSGPTKITRDAVRALHAQLPTYGPTPLISLPRLASELGIEHVFLKDEGPRCGLGAFKILGASWAIYRAICERTGLPFPSLNDSDSPATIAALPKLHEAADAAQKAGIRLLAATEGNWGRAVAHMASLLGIRAVIYVSSHMHEATRARIIGEGNTEIVVVEGDYDDAVTRVTDVAATVASSATGQGLLVMDTAWPGFEKIPAWVVEGYTTMLSEVDEQLEAALGHSHTPPSVAVAGVGVGSWAQAVVLHYKQSASSRVPEDEGVKETVAPLVVAVEASAAPCLFTSLMTHSSPLQTPAPVATTSTIMAGLNCGTLSSLAWPILSHGVDYSVLVTDEDAHRAVLELQRGDLCGTTSEHKSHGVQAGPCGAATVMALRRVLHQTQIASQGRKLNVAVLFSTEGARPYEFPITT